MTFTIHSPIISTKRSERSKMSRNIVHMQIPDFYAALEELRRPELKRLPLVLARAGERSVVQGVNAPARKEGLREGMALGRARRMCRRLHTVEADFYHYREKQLEMARCFGGCSPLVESSGQGSCFIDITGTRGLFGPGPDLACRMERELAEKMGLRARIGLAANKLVSQVAAHCIQFARRETWNRMPLPVVPLVCITTHRSRSTSRD